jgi:hypothetical protein
METTAKVGSVKGMAEAFLVGRAPMGSLSELQQTQVELQEAEV